MGVGVEYQFWWMKPFLRSQFLDIEDVENPRASVVEDAEERDVLASIPLAQIFYFWKLAGGDVESELAKRDLLLNTPPIERIPRTVKVLDGKEEGTRSDSAFIFSDMIYTLSLKELRQRLEAATGPNKETFDWDTDYFLIIETDDMNFLVDSMSDDGVVTDDLLIGRHLFPDSGGGHSSSSNASTSLPSSTNGVQQTPAGNVKLPLLIREKDVGYQFQRVALFSELLQQYPASREEVIHHAKVDIPPFLRGKIWATILGVTGDYQAVYDAYDKETEKETQTDRQVWQFNDMVLSDEIVGA
jgi:hypothetical protein